MARTRKKSGESTANLGFEQKLWAAADALRELAAQQGEGADAEDPDEYRAVNIFWVPPEARWHYLKSMAPQPTIGQLVRARATELVLEQADVLSDGWGGGNGR